MNAIRDMLRSVIPALLLPVSAAYSRLRPGIRILMYHRVDSPRHYDQLCVTPERFEEQMAYLAKHCRVIGLTQALEELDSPRRLRPGVVVTFDDGYRDNLTNALPVLIRHRIPATIFVTTRFCDGTHSHPRYQGRGETLHLDWEGVGKLARTGAITIGSHTLSHPHLTRLSDEEAEAEIAESRRQIEQKAGLAVEFFCYPSGDFGAREMMQVEKAGYRAALSVAPGANRHRTSRFALRRTEVTDRDGAAELRAKLLGAYDPIHLALHRRRVAVFRGMVRASAGGGAR